MNNELNRASSQPVTSRHRLARQYDFLVRLKGRDILSPSFDEFMEFGV